MQIHKLDNVRVDLQSGHKYALCDIAEGDAVIKYGNPIGHATAPIKAGEHVHTHNLATDLSDEIAYTYVPYEAPPTVTSDMTFLGYARRGGEVGIRNDVWIIPTVGCVNKIAERLAERTGAFAFVHPYGCSQLGEDHALTRTVLCALVKHPNAGGVLVLGLGCENNTIEQFREALGDFDTDRVRFLICQDSPDELAEGEAIIRKLQAHAACDERIPFPISRLRVGLKCGGSDGYSGISANPLVGRFADRLCAVGGSCVLTEVPEMFGAEHLLMRRAVSREVFDKTVALINDFKGYYKRHGQVVYENPSPGNKAGGITTLEEKSLGCVQKGGLAPVTDVLGYGEAVRTSGLSLLDGPGNDIVAITNLAAAGVHLILFTTGRGTPLGAPVPTVKIATNRTLAERKAGWIDFDASGVLSGEELDERFFSFVLSIASGKETKNEENGFREIAIFKDGVTL